MSNYKAFGDLQTVLEEKAYTELDMMDEAIGVFTEVVVDMIAVQEVAEVAESASSPQEEAEVQTFVENNIEVLTITQEEVDTYNTSMDDIETHANNASAFLAVAGNKEAVEFLEQGVENANTTAEQTNIFYDANAQWVAMGYNTTRNLTAVYLNGQNYGLDLYVSEAEVLAVGSESEYYLTGPTSQSYDCFMYETGCMETMSLEDTELKIGGTSFKGVWIAIVLGIGSTIGGGVWTASSLYSRLEAVESTQIPDVSPIQQNLATLGTRLETLLSQQEKLLELNTDVSELANEIEAMKGTVAKAEIIIENIGDVDGKIKTLTKEVEDLWLGMDYLNANPLQR